MGQSELCEGDQDWFCFFAPGGELVRNMAGVSLLALFDEAVMDEVFDSLRQQRGRNAREALAQFDVAARRVNEEISQDEKCPAVSHEVERHRDGAIQVVTALRGDSGFLGSQLAHTTMVHFLYQKGKS